MISGQHSDQARVAVAERSSTVARVSFLRHHAAMRIALLCITSLLFACGSDDGEDNEMGADGGTLPGADGGVGQDASQPTSGFVDPNCLDGMYAEAFPDVNADISDLSFDGDIGNYVDAILVRRYTTGAQLVAGGRTNTSFGDDCDILFAGSPNTGAEVISRINTIVHECGHLYDFTLGSGSTDGYFITSDLTFTCQRGDTTSRGGDTFARSRINNDSYSSLRPPCGSGDCDSYAPIYLDGNPDDQEFDGGDQGFNLLFEEAVQYVNSLATEWAFVDQMSQGQRTSARDGILTFLWWIERYLKMARVDYPAAYTRITNPCWRDAILKLWGRAWLYLEATENMTPLGIDDDAIFNLVSDPDLLGEIQRLRDLQGC